jgi:integrase
MTDLPVLDAAGRRRSPATLPGYHAGRPPRNKGMRPPDPPTVEEIVAVMCRTADDRHGWRVRAMIVVLWRVGLRIQEALALAERDLDHRRGSILVRVGKGGRRREVGMDDPGHRPGGDHRHCSHAPSAHDVRHRRPAALNVQRERAGAPAPPCRTRRPPQLRSRLAPVVRRRTLERGPARARFTRRAAPR